MRVTLRVAALLGLLLAAGKGLAIPASDLKETYQPIIDRNPFGLKPPAPPATNIVAPPVKEKPKVEIFLTGITSIGYPRLPKQVYLMTKDPSKKEPAYYTLMEGVEKDGIKIVNIDDVGRKVKAQTDDGEVLLTFQTHGIAPPVAPQPPKPGMPGQPIPGQPIPGQPGVYPVPQPGQPQPAMGSVAQPQPLTTAFQPANNAATASSTSTGLRQIPTRRVRAGDPINGGGVPQTPYGGAGVPPQNEMDPAEQYVRMHLNRAAAEKQGIPQPPLPIVQ